MKWNDKKLEIEDEEEYETLDMSKVEENMENFDKFVEDMNEGLKKKTETIRKEVRNIVEKYDPHLLEEFDAQKFEVNDEEEMFKKLKEEDEPVEYSMTREEEAEMLKKLKGEDELLEYSKARDEEEKHVEDSESGKWKEWSPSKEEYSEGMNVEEENPIEKRRAVLEEAKKRREKMKIDRKQSLEYSHVMIRYKKRLDALKRTDPESYQRFQKMLDSETKGEEFMDEREIEKMEKNPAYALYQRLLTIEHIRRNNKKEHIKDDDFPDEETDYMYDELEEPSTPRTSPNVITKMTSRQHSKFQKTKKNEHTIAVNKTAHVVRHVISILSRCWSSYANIFLRK